MEGLVNSSRITTIGTHFRQKNLAFVPTSSVQFTRSLYRSGSQVGIEQHHLSLKPIAASIQPVEATPSSRSGNMLPSKEVLELWRNADAVCFDVDSTVCLDEGIDELAEFCGAGKAVAEWTSRAMSGSVPFEEALAARLSLFNPSLSQLQDYLEKRPPRISPGIAELVNKLKANKTTVYLVSGGFRQMIYVACCINPWDTPGKRFRQSTTVWKYLLGSGSQLSIAEKTTGTNSKGLTMIDRWHSHTGHDSSSLANPNCKTLRLQDKKYLLLLAVKDKRVIPNSNGEFVGFDENEPTSRSGGKATAVQRIRKAHNYKELVMIGDGATDLEACQPGGADLFICYAGVQHREAVAEKADWLVFNFEELMSALD